MSESSHESPRGFEIRSSIPVLRMFDEAKAKAFYLDYLGSSSRASVFFAQIT
jgi:hypothetical protein